MKEVSIRQKQFLKQTLPVHIIITEIIHILLPLICSYLPKHSNQSMLHGYSWIINFDGIHYFNNNYEYEPNFAFFPLFVKFIAFLKCTMGPTLALVIIISLNRLLFVLNAYNIYKILKRFDSTGKVAKFGVIIYLYNPASIFFHVVYTQSLFGFITCTAVRVALDQQQNSDSIKSTLLLSSSVALRSNGIFLSPIIGLQILIQFITKLRNKTVFSIKTLAKGLLILILIIIPLVFHLIFCYINFCIKGNKFQQVCLKNGANLYSYIQQKYWNVGLFTYFTMKNIVFIMIGAPAILISGLGLLIRSQNFTLRQRGIQLSFIILFAITLTLTNIQSGTRFFSTHPYFYFILASFSIKWKIVRIWILLYYFMGMLFYTVGFPWT